MATLYLNEDLHPDAFAVGARLPVWGADARHAAQVARVRTGERIGVGDGRGRIGWGPVVHVAQQEVAIEVAELAVDPARRPRLILVQALAKGDRDELAVQAATELGVDEIVPWQAARSISRWEGPKAAKAVERWRSVVREASKQAIRATVPEVRALATTRSLAERLRGSGGDDADAGPVALVLEPGAQESLAGLLVPTGSIRRSGSNGSVDDPPGGLVGRMGAAESVLLVVGPEGGIAPEELRELELAGARLVRLGPEVLRTSTAGPAAIAALSALLGRW
ncbi:MAG: 16S rRNA (uracil(1498)-N(3))-methyltransferase [Micrococcales bacterium 73-13]|nr:MAG: 16S rRNA (uracil(1498)-N(3))-methyltransferase [Micrococcales bacterium 73-13]